MRGRVLGALALALTGVAVACSSANGESRVKGSGGASGSGGADGGSAASSGFGGGSGSTGLPPGCASNTYDGQLVPLDMFMVLDHSESMTDTVALGSTKWSAVTGAISQFVALPGLTGLGMGLGFFPNPPSTPPPSTCVTLNDCGNYGPCTSGKCATTCPLGFCNLGGTDSCDYPDYTTPVVPIAPLPGVGSQISSALSSQQPNGGTPMDPALHGAIAYAEGWSQQHTDHITIVVLATDGNPSGCDPDNVNTVAARADQGLNSTPSIKTFVIGVGSSLTSLNKIAASGGTTQAIIVDTATNPGQQFLDALDQIRGAIGCNYNIPDSGGQAPDYGKVNVAFTPSGGAQDILKNTGNAGGCQGGPGWYYDNPSNPTQIILCPSSCDVVSNQPGKVDVVVGCQTIVK